MPIIEEKVKEMLSLHSGIDEDEIENDATMNSLYLDSLDQIEILMMVEEEFDIEFSDAEAETIKSVQDLIKLVESKQK